MDELPKSMRGEDCFFNDGDDATIGRIDEGENFVDAYDLHEANPGQVQAQSGTQGSSENKATVDQYDFRMEGRGNPNEPPKGMKIKSSQNTGAKGVKKDFEDSKQAVRIQKNFDRLRANRDISRAVDGSKNFYVDDIVNEMSQLQRDATIQTEEERERERIKERMRQRKVQLLDSDSDLDEDSDDDVLFAKFRDERLKTIQASLPSYGNYMKADSLEDLAELLKNNHELCYVVVHAYANKNNCCISLHLTFEAIASQFPHVAFIRIRSDMALGADYAPSALPTLLLYKGSKLHKSVMSVGAILGATPTDRAVVQFLVDQGVLRMPTMGLENIKKTDKRLWKEGYEEGNSDDEGSKPNANIRSSTLTRGFGFSGFDTGILAGSSQTFAAADSDDETDHNDIDDDLGIY